MSPLPPPHVSRPLLERLAAIHRQVQQNKRPNCSSLARDIGVSVKTIQRDIDFLRDRYNLPLEYDPSKHGYYYTEPVAGLPAVQMSEGEVVAMLVAQKALEQYRGTPFEHALEHAFAKITAALKDMITIDSAAVLSGISFKPLGTSAADLETFEVISSAQRSHHEVAFTYVKPRAKSSERRTVHPYHLACVQNLWYLLAFDPTRNAYRTFALPRISSPSIGKTPFERRKDFSTEKILGTAFGIMAGTGSHEVKIDFDAFAAPYIRERTWHRSQRIEERPRGVLRLRLTVARLEEVLNWILSWGSHVKVLGPKELKQQVFEAGRAIAKAHQC
jgi:predicted DNA-binding transcriptional regulator YafY